MITRIYVLLFAFFAVIMSALTCYACSWLSSIDDPRAVVSNYEYYSNLSGMFLAVTASILLVLANVGFWKSGKSWAFWSTFFYFAVFIVLHTFWLNESFFEIKRANGFAAESISLSPFLGAWLIITAAFLIFADRLIVGKVRARMLPETGSETLRDDENNTT